MNILTIVRIDEHEKYDDDQYIIVVRENENTETGSIVMQGLPSLPERDVIDMGSYILGAREFASEVKTLSLKRPLPFITADNDVDEKELLDYLGEY
jgi:hypothetical protein